MLPFERAPSPRKVHGCCHVPTEAEEETEDRTCVSITRSSNWHRGPQRIRAGMVQRLRTHSCALLRTSSTARCCAYSIAPAAESLNRFSAAYCRLIGGLGQVTVGSGNGCVWQAKKTTRGKTTTSQSKMWVNSNERMSHLHCC